MKMADLVCPIEVNILVYTPYHKPSKESGAFLAFCIFEQKQQLVFVNIYNFATTSHF